MKLPFLFHGVPQGLPDILLHLAVATLCSSMDGGGVGGGEGGGEGGGGGREPPTRRLAFHHALHFPDLRARVYFSEENNNVAASQSVIMIVVQSFYPGVCTLCSGVWPLKFAVWQKTVFQFPLEALIQSLCTLLLKQTH